MIIEDSSTGNAATVTKEGRLYVESVTQSQETYHASKVASAYIVGNPSISMTGTEKNVLYLKNTSSIDDLHIVTTYATTTTSGVYVKLLRGSAYSSGGSSATPNNMKFSSNLSASADVYYGDNMTLTSSGTALVGGYLTPGMTEFNFTGSLILGPSDTIAFTINGPTGQYATLGVRFFYHGGMY